MHTQSLFNRINIITKTERAPEASCRKIGYYRSRILRGLGSIGKNIFRSNKKLPGSRYSKAIDKPGQ
jgi:hypothetical protein